MPTEILPVTSFAEIAVTLLQEANGYAHSNGQLEHLTARMSIAGLNDEIASRIIADARRRAEVLGDAHQLMRAMCDHEQAIRRIITPTQSRAPWLRGIIGGDR